MAKGQTEQGRSFGDSIELFLLTPPAQTGCAERQPVGAPWSVQGVGSLAGRMLTGPTVHSSTDLWGVSLSLSPGCSLEGVEGERASLFPAHATPCLSVSPGTARIQVCPICQWSAGAPTLNRKCGLWPLLLTASLFLEDIQFGQEKTNIPSPWTFLGRKRAAYGAKSSPELGLAADSKIPQDLCSACVHLDSHVWASLQV